jgi:predicted nuclease of predicted toxin-antitoxin system
LPAKLVIDANLSPQWAALLGEAGHDALRWFDVGKADASDRTIMAWTQRRGYTVFTHDLDLSALLAATQAVGPSVLQVHAQDVLPDAMGAVVRRALRQFADELHAGAIVTVDPSRARAHLLPLAGGE